MSEVSTKTHDDNKGQGGGKDHQVTIMVNAEPHEVDDKEITFDELVRLAYDGSPPTGDNWEFTVTYRKAHGNKEGSLVAGGSVKVKDGMIFNVTGTDKS